MERQPRSMGARVTRMMVLVILASAASSALVAVTNRGEVAVLVIAVLYAFLATRVSLPWYYVAWFLVPFVGVYAIWKISWRAAYLPWRDWDLREGEARSPYDVAHDLYGVRERMVQVRTD